MHPYQNGIFLLLLSDYKFCFQRSLLQMQAFYQDSDNIHIVKNEEKYFLMFPNRYALNICHCMKNN